MKMRTPAALLAITLAHVAIAQDKDYGASACSVSTVYLPVTETVISEMSNRSSSALVPPVSGSYGAMPSVVYTSTSTQTLTSYVTIDRVALSSKAPFVYTVDPSGSTSWINGVSPSSGISLVTATTSVFVTAVALSEGVIPLSSATLGTESVSAPAYTSKVYSYVGSDITLTSTSTSTNYVTFTLSYAGPSSIDSRTSFLGIGSKGWNASATIRPTQLSAISSSINPESTTHTSIYYQGNGDQTTSTTTTFITTTVAVRYTVTITRSDSSSAFVTTITALPVTITDQSGSQSTSTAIQLTTDTAIPVLSSMSTTLSGSAFIGMTTARNSSTVMMPVAQSSSSSLTLLVNATSTLLPSYPQQSGESSFPLQTQATSSAISTKPATASSLTSGVSSTFLSLASTSPIIPQSLTFVSTNARTQITISTSRDMPIGSSNFRTLNSTTTAAVSAAVSASSLSVWTVVPSVSSTLSSEVSAVSAVSTARTSSLEDASMVVSNSTVEPSNQSIMSTLSTVGSKTTAGPGGGSSFGSSHASTLPLRSSLLPYGRSSGFSSIAPPSTLDTTIRFSLASASSSSSNVSSRSQMSKGRASETSHGSSTFDAATSGSTVTTLPLSGIPSSSNGPNAAISTNTNRDISATAGAQSKHSGTLQSYQGPTSRTLSSSASSNPFPASSATVTPTTGCGEHGEFIIDFDNLPNFMPADQNQTDITHAPPIENPYYHLVFSDGYVYAPQPREPFTPVSAPRVAVFLATASGKRVSAPAGNEGNYSKSGEISDGPRESISAFWFDAYSAFLGCDNAGPEVCTMVLSAYTWDPMAKTEVLAGRQNATINPCPELEDCKLQQVGFPDSFHGLTGLQIQAFVGQMEKMFFMDDLTLRWTNNTCAAGMLRQSSM